MPTKARNKQRLDRAHKQSEDKRKRGRRSDRGRDSESRSRSKSQVYTDSRNERSQSRDSSKSGSRSLSQSSQRAPMRKTTAPAEMSEADRLQQEEYQTAMERRRIDRTNKQLMASIPTDPELYEREKERRRMERELRHKLREEQEAKQASIKREREGLCVSIFKC